MSNTPRRASPRPGRRRTNSDVRADYSNVNTSENIKVFVRLRPPDDGSEPPPEMLEFNKGRTGSMLIRNPKKSKYGTHKFKFDNVFDHQTTQEVVYTKVALPLVNHVLRGYNACCFAYGQTGSGKTYSVFGESQKQKGILPRCIEQLFSQIRVKSTTHTHKITVCVLEMYCDQLRDLGKAAIEKNESVTAEWFAKRNKVSIYGAEKDRFGDEVSSRLSRLKNAGDTEPEYRIYEDVHGQTFVRGAQYMSVENSQKLMEIVERSFRLRATHETNINPVSSRSHTIVQIRVEATTKNTGVKVAGVLNVVDLAGSERVLKSAAEGQRLREALFINSSLSAIGKVIMALDPSSSSETSYIPYRDSKLTRILQNSLGGNSYTTLLATIHPLPIHYEECLSTLHFATHCRRVTNQVSVNRMVTSVDKDRQIRRLRAEVGKLRAQIAYLQEALRKNTYNIMTQLNLQGEMLADGRFRMLDGRVVGDAVVTLSDDVSTPRSATKNSLSPPQTGTPTGQSKSYFSSSKKKSDVSKINMRAIAGSAVSTMQYMASQAAHRNQLKRAKAKLASTRLQLSQHQEQANETEKGLRAQIMQMKDRLKTAREEYDDLQSHSEEMLLQKKHEHELQQEELLNNHKSIMRTTLVNQAKSMLVSKTLNLTRDSDSISSAVPEGTQTTRVSRRKERRQREMTDMAKTHMLDKKAQISFIKQQCRHWMDKRDKEMKAYVSQVNNFYRRKREQVQECQQYIVNLYSVVDLLAEKLGEGSKVIPFNFAPKTPVSEAMAPGLKHHLGSLLKTLKADQKKKNGDNGVSVRWRKPNKNAGKQNGNSVSRGFGATPSLNSSRRRRPPSAVPRTRRPSSANPRARKGSSHLTTLRTLGDRGRSPAQLADY